MITKTLGREKHKPTNKISQTFLRRLNHMLIFGAYPNRSHIDDIEDFFFKISEDAPVRLFLFHSR